MAVRSIVVSALLAVAHGILSSSDDIASDYYLGDDVYDDYYSGRFLGDKSQRSCKTKVGQLVETITTRVANIVNTNGCDIAEKSLISVVVRSMNKNPLSDYFANYVNKSFAPKCPAAMVGLEATVKAAVTDIVSTKVCSMLPFGGWSAILETNTTEDEEWFEFVQMAKAEALKLVKTLGDTLEGFCKQTIESTADQLVIPFATTVKTKLCDLISQKLGEYVEKVLSTSSLTKEMVPTVRPYTEKLMKNTCMGFMSKTVGNLGVVAKDVLKNEVCTLAR